MDMDAASFEVPSGRPARGRVAAPPSKSFAIRALVCAALAGGTSTLRGLARCDADDVVRTVEALRALGFVVDGERVTGAAGRIPDPAATLDLGGSGTAFRFLTAVAALGPGPTTLTGDASLRRRPMDSIAAPLRTLGVEVDGEPRGRELPPLVVRGGPPRRAETAVETSQTSQSLSALLLIGPVTPSGLALEPRGAGVSAPYVEATLHVMFRFGAVCARTSRRLSTFPSGYTATDTEIEGDWSGASYPLAAAAVTRGAVEVTGLGAGGRQADAAVARVLAEFGASVERAGDAVRVTGRRLAPVTLDLRECPDLAPLVGALACLAPGVSRVSGAAHLRLKESDRIAAVVDAARTLGCRAEATPDGFEIEGPATRGGLVATRNDHRIAMAFAVAGLAVPGVVIDDARCVVKSYPRFWDDLRALLGA